MNRPSIVSAALVLLWMSFACATVEVAFTIAVQLQLVPLSVPGEESRWTALLFGPLGLLVQAACVVAVGRGHGSIRWLLLVGIGWFIANGAGLTAAASLIAPYRRIEPIAGALRMLGVLLLFLPPSSIWFQRLRRSRRTSFESATPVTNVPDVATPSVDIGINPPTVAVQLVPVNQENRNEG